MLDRITATRDDRAVILCMLLGSIYLTIVGSGAWSLDALLARRSRATSP